MSTRHRVRAAASGLCLLAVLASSDRSRPAEAAAPPATGRAATAIGTCDGRQLGEWQFVAREQMRVQARGRSGNDWVGLTAATDGFHDWAPFDDFKTTICGALGIFGTFEPTREKEFLRFLPEIPEHDWNVILIPTARSIFDERFRLARRLMERGHEGDLVSCQGTPCFEAEVTPQSRLLKANSAGGWLTSCRRGQTLCTFGPWVGDGGHGYRPEIHPAERIWWRDGDRLKLIAVQDASQRFRDHRQFQWADTREPSHAASVLAVWGPYLPSTDLPERPTADCIDITAFIVRFPNLPSATAKSAQRWAIRISCNDCTSGRTTSLKTTDNSGTPGGTTGAVRPELAAASGSAASRRPWSK